MISLQRALALFGSCSNESELQWSQKFWISWIQLFSSSWKWKVRKKYTVLVEPQFSGWLKSIEILKNVTRRAVIVSAWGVLKAFHLFFKFWFYIPTMDVVCIHWLLGRNSQDMSSKGDFTTGFLWDFPQDGYDLLLWYFLSSIEINQS